MPNKSSIISKFLCGVPVKIVSEPPEFIPMTLEMWVNSLDCGICKKAISVPRNASFLDEIFSEPGNRNLVVEELMAIPKPKSDIKLEKALRRLKAYWASLKSARRN